MPRGETPTAIISTHEVSRNHVPSHHHSVRVPEEVIGEALAAAGINKDDPRLDEFIAVAEKAGILAAHNLITVDTVSIMVNGAGRTGRKFAPVAAQQPAYERPL